MRLLQGSTGADQSLRPRFQELFYLPQTSMSRATRKFLHMLAVFHAVQKPISVSICDQTKNASRWSNQVWAEASILSGQLLTLQPHSPAWAFVFAVSSTGAGNISALSSTPQIGLELVTMCDVWRWQAFLPRHKDSPAPVWFVTSISILSPNWLSWS